MLGLLLPGRFCFNVVTQQSETRRTERPELEGREKTLQVHLVTKKQTGENEHRKSGNTAGSEDINQEKKSREATSGNSKCVCCLPLPVCSMCTAAVAGGWSYSQSPSCGGGEPLPVMDFQLPVYQTEKKGHIFSVRCLLVCQ